eukprot:RCo029427
MTASLFAFCFLLLLLMGTGWTLRVEHHSRSAANPYVVDVILRTYGGDVDCLGFALRSLDRFAGSLFRAVHIVAPRANLPFLKYLERPRSRDLIPRYLHGVDEFTNGYNQQMYDKIHSDEFSDAEFIYHVDSDLVMTRAVHWSDLFSEDLKPWLPLRRWENMGGSQVWKSKTDHMVNLTCPFGFMVRHGLIYPRIVYRLLRERIRQVHGVSVREYFLARGGQIGSEFEALGLVAWSLCRDRVALWNMDETPWRSYVNQARSWDGLTGRQILFYECLLSTVSPGPIVGPVNNRTALLLKNGEAQARHCEELLTPEILNDLNR